MSQTNGMTADALRYLDAHLADFTRELCDLSRIPSVSANGFPKEEVRRSAEATADALRRARVDNVRVLEIPGVHPYVCGEWLKRPGAPTLLLYGHHDVQPPGRPEKWLSPPFEPTERGGRLYGRGTADDKGGVMVHVAAVGAYLEAAGTLPCNVKFIVEGEEEIGSLDVPGLYKKVARPSATQRGRIRALPFNEATYKKEAGMLPGVRLGGEKRYSVYERLWTRPALTVIALEARQFLGSSNQIIEAARARLSLRIVPGMNARESGKLLARRLSSHRPHGARVSARVTGATPSWTTDPEGPAFDAARRALKAGFGREAAMMGSGGTIRFVAPCAQV